MAGYGVKDANRALREQKDSKPESHDCNQCEDTGFVMQGGMLRQCPTCLAKEVEGVYAGN